MTLQTTMKAMQLSQALSLTAQNGEYATYTVSISRLWSIEENRKRYKKKVVTQRV